MYINVCIDSVFGSVASSPSFLLIMHHQKVRSFLDRHPRKLLNLKRRLFVQRKTLCSVTSTNLHHHHQQREKSMSL